MQSKLTYSIDLNISLSFYIVLICSIIYKTCIFKMILDPEEFDALSHHVLPQSLNTNNSHCMNLLAILCNIYYCKTLTSTYHQLELWMFRRFKVHFICMSSAYFIYILPSTWYKILYMKTRKLAILKAVIKLETDVEGQKK